MGAESERVAGFGGLEDGLRDASPWYLWGPYVTERQWGTVREDYSAGGDAWSAFPHDHARSRAYRWGEDGLAGFCDIEQRLCLGLSLWNGNDPILKERIFGLTGPQGNHGEDAKEYWWYKDSVPSHAWNRWRYHYPQREFPYADLVTENGRRGLHDPEYELLDTGAFEDDRYWVVEVDYAKADPTDVLMTVRVTNAGPARASLHVLPTAWFRNTWSWEPGAETPSMARATSSAAPAIEIEHPFLGPLELVAGPDPAGAAPSVLFCENETNAPRVFGSSGMTDYPKDGINDHVLHGAATVNPKGVGTKAAFWYRLDVGAGETVELRLRLRPQGGTAPAPLGADFEAVNEARQQEADEFYAELTPAGTSEAEAQVLRQASAGLLWCKQLYYYDVARWLKGDPGHPEPPAVREQGRNRRWRNFDAFDIMSMPDSWEYPWFATWDMAFHCVALAHLDPAFAKYQLILLCREWFQQPDGALPAYEWNFDDVNPPVHAWAALEVFTIDGARDIEFLERIFAKLTVNFTWWVNRQNVGDSDLFKGGFLGLDNIGPLDRSNLPVDGTLAQADGTAWMAFYSLALGAMASVLRRHGRPTTDLVLKFLEHFALISDALESQGMWDEEDGFYYDKLTLRDGSVHTIQVRSMVGVLPVFATVVLDEHAIVALGRLGKQFAHFVGERLPSEEELREGGQLRGPEGNRHLMLGVVGVDKALRVLEKLLDEDEFLSPYGLRALSRVHLEQPYTIDVGGLQAFIDYEPAESTTHMFGGNSNWRGPIWMPLNHLMVSTLERFGRFFGDQVTVEYPTGSGNRATLLAVADDLRDRLISIFVPDGDGRRPCFGGVEKMQTDPRWRDNLLFNEYFHGDNGAGLGASHQTGWTAVVVDLIRRRPGSGVATLPSLLGIPEIAPRIGETPSEVVVAQVPVEPEPVEVVETEVVEPEVVEPEVVAVAEPAQPAPPGDVPAFKRIGIG